MQRFYTLVMAALCITAASAQTQEALFTDKNEDNLNYYDQSWVNVTAPSQVTQPFNEKLPVSSEIKRGEEGNSLQLTWTSADAGNWMALVASIDWKHFDISGQQFISLWLYSEEGITAENLPKVHLEAHVGGTTGDVPLGQYVNGLTANQWTEIFIPIEDLRKANSDFSAYNDIKGLFFCQDKADGKEHTLYIDDIYFTSDSTSSVAGISGQSGKITFANGLITGVSGNVRIYDISGHLIAAGTAKGGAFPAALSTGLYIVTDNGSTGKIIVR